MQASTTATPGDQAPRRDGWGQGTPEQQRIAESFVAALEGLRGEDDRAALARLKRCAGRSLGECPEVYSLFYRLLPGQARGNGRLEEICFLVATLYPLASEKAAVDLGTALRQLANSDRERAQGLDRRVGVLLDADLESLNFRLRQAVSLLSSKDIGLDWRQLLVDVLQWEWNGRPVQRRWARSFFGSQREEEAAAE